MEPCVANDEVSDCLCRSCRLHSDLARVTAERDEARLRATELGARVAAISKDLGDAWIERDAARSEVARLTAEVEAMRAVVERIHNDINLRYLCGDEIADAALDALRARKVGG